MTIILLLFCYKRIRCIVYGCRSKEAILTLILIFPQTKHLITIKEFCKNIPLSVKYLFEKKFSSSGEPLKSLSLLLVNPVYGNRGLKANSTHFAYPKLAGA